MSTSKKHKERLEPRPIPRHLLERARPVAARYQITVWHENGEWYGQGVEEPGAMADGKTLTQCVRNVREALAGIIASHLDDDEPVVTPIIDQQRRRRKAG